MPSESKYRDPYLINKLRRDVAESKKYASSKKLKTLLGQNDQLKPLNELEKQLEAELLKPKALTEKDSIEIPKSHKHRVKAIMQNCFLCCMISSEQVKKA